MKKVLSLILVFVLCIGVCFSAPFTLKVSAASVSSLTFKLNSDGKSYYVSDCNESVSGDLEIPSTYNDLPVTSIGYHAFYNCTSLTSITIPDSVTSIGDYAFYNCTSLTSVTIPDSVTSIGFSAFYNCTSLTSVNITNLAAWCNIDFGDRDANPLYYARDLYLNGELVTELQIPGSVTSIGDYAFRGCTSLTSITVPDSVTSIGYYAFQECTSLTSITIPDSVTSIGSSAFYNTAYYNDTNNLENDVLYIGNHLIEAKITLSGDYVIKSGTKCIAGGAFYNCTSLTSITIPDSVTSIGYDAFENCTSLTNITIPDSVTSIGYNAFRGCTSLTSITIPDSVTSIGDEAFYNCKSLTSITIPDSVTSIGYDAFYNTAYYKDTNNWENDVLYIGNHLIEAKTTLSGDYVIKSGTKCIAGDAFRSCTSLTSITIPDSVTSIGNKVFYNCTSLTSITIPDSVTSIGSSAFSGCTSLASITIPDSVTSIGSYAFYNCTSLTSINITNLAAWCNIDFSGSYANPLYYAKNLYLSHSLQKNLLIPEGVTEIKPYAFYNCKSIINIKLPKSLKKVGSDAFYVCSNIEMVAISDLTAWCNIDFSGSYANPLYYAEDLYLNGKLVTELQIPGSVTSIGYYAFSGCTSLTSITIPDSVTSIGDGAFRSCDSLTSITIPDSVTSIGSYVFDGCTSLTSITIPDSVTSIGDYAFYNCKSLTSITILDSVTSIGDYAFYNCKSLTSIIIPESVTSIGYYAFSDCTSLKYVFYPGSSADWNKISIGSNNSKLTSSSIHYNTTEHSCTVVKNLPFFEGMEGSVEEICSVCGFINSSNKLLWLNDYITAVDTKNVVLDTEANMLLLDISACTDISDAIIETEGYTITAIPNSSYGFIGTGSKLKVSTTSGTQVAEYTLVVRGDVNGDSVCDGIDLMLIELARHESNNVTLEGAYFTAANLAEDSEINVDDFNAVVNKAVA